MATAVAVMSGVASSGRAVCIGRNTSLTPSPPPAAAAAATLSRSVRLSCRTRGKTTCCEVALRSEYSNWNSKSNSDPNSNSMEEEDDKEDEEDEEVRSNMGKVGSKVRVKAPIKVYHVTKLPDLELTPDMLGVIKQYVGFWKGKRISPNYPFKVEFVLDGLGRAGAPLKFVAHLKEDEFQIVP